MKSPVFWRSQNCHMKSKSELTKVRKAGSIFTPVTARWNWAQYLSPYALKKKKSMKKCERQGREAKRRSLVPQGRCAFLMLGSGTEKCEAWSPWLTEFKCSSHWVTETCTRMRFSAPKGMTLESPTSALGNIRSWGSGIEGTRTRTSSSVTGINSSKCQWMINADYKNHIYEQIMVSTKAFEKWKCS